jgi:DNA invertase Pin-like site-specific DNA recombinase
MLAIYCRTSREKKDRDTSTIEQQKQKGIEFALSRKLPFTVFADEGKSGFQIADDDSDPFNNRPSFANLVNQIKHKKIDSIWVWEHSRLSRNQYASAIIFNLFERYNITVYENNEQLNLKDPQFQMFRQILDAIAQYERNLIVGRTTRGLHNAIDSGRRGYNQFFGYIKIGKTTSGNLIWQSVASEIECLKYAYKRIFESVSIRQITRELCKLKMIDEKFSKNLIAQWGNILSHYEYTGFALNTQGLKILKRYMNFEIDSLSELHDKQYWVPSIPYPIKLISIPQWIATKEIIQVNRLRRKKILEEKKTRTGSALATGLIQCECGERYYIRSARSVYKEKVSKYDYYSHLVTNKAKECKQRPKSLKAPNVNEIFKIFYFYYYLVFDNSKQLIEESQITIKQEQLKIKEQIISLEKKIKVYNKQVEKLNNAIEQTEDVGAITVLASRINTLHEQNIHDREQLSLLKIHMEGLKEKYTGNDLQNTYQSVREKIIHFFEKCTTEQQRDELIQILESCKLFGPYLTITARKKLFIFDTRVNYTFSNEQYKKFFNNKVYMHHFLGLPDNQKWEALLYDGNMVNNWILKDADIKLLQKYVKTISININLKEYDNLINFTDKNEYFTFLIHNKIKNTTLLGKK